MSELEVGEPIESVGLQRPQIKSPYFESALTITREEAPAVQEEVAKLLQKIDQQGIENITSYESQIFKGVRIPYSKVDVNRLASENFDLLTGGHSDKREIHIIFSGFAMPPAGHPFTAWDMVYDRAIGLLPKVVNPQAGGEKPPLVEIYSLGSPNGLGGKVTREWIEANGKKGFSIYGEVYAELVKSLLPQDRENTRIIFEGMSMGSLVVEQTFKHLSESERKNVQLLIDNPINYRGGKLVRSPRGVQTVAGFLAEVGIRGVLSKRSRQEFAEDKLFSSELADYLKQEGFEDDEEQIVLKKEAAKKDARNMFKGMELDTESMRLFIRRGEFDPTTFTPENLFAILWKKSRGKNPVSGSGRSLEFAVGESHFIDRMRVKKWERIINFCKKIKPVSS